MRLLSKMFVLSRNVTTAYSAFVCNTSRALAGRDGNYIINAFAGYDMDNSTFPQFKATVRDAVDDLFKSFFGSHRDNDILRMARYASAGTHQQLSRTVQQLRIGWIHYVLAVPWCRRAPPTNPAASSRRLRSKREALLDQDFKLVFAHALAPARQGGTLEVQPVLEKFLAVQILKVWVVHPPLAQRLIDRL